MGRGEPNTRSRLERAAIELYLERGFEGTTVAEIAARAGLTERTFFRYFADKREVLFGGSAELQCLLVEGVADAPATASPIEAVAAGLAAVAPIFDGRWSGARKRQAVINANPELQERELIKLATLASAVTEALRERGVAEPAASLAAQAGLGVFHVAFQLWVTAPRKSDLARRFEESFATLRIVAGS